MRQFRTITLSYSPFHIITFQSSHVKSECFWPPNQCFFLWNFFASVPPKKLPYNTPNHIKKKFSHWSCQDFSYWGWGSSHFGRNRGLAHHQRLLFPFSICLVMNGNKLPSPLCICSVAISCQIFFLKKLMSLFASNPCDNFGASSCSNSHPLSWLEISPLKVRSIGISIKVKTKLCKVGYGVLF